LKYCIFIVASFLFFGLTQQKPRWVGQKFPLISGATTKGHKIDSTYFNGKVTLITFFHVGCQPCLFEINWLKKLKKQPGFQVLYIVPHTTKEMQLFNSSEPNYYSRIRRKNKAGTIDFDILSECEVKNKPTKDTLCNAVSEKLRVTGYPTTFLLDGRLIIRQVWYGFAMDTVSAKQKIADWQKEIDKLQKAKK